MLFAKVFEVKNAFSLEKQLNAFLYENGGIEIASVTQSTASLSNSDGEYYYIVTVTVIYKA